jgi:hypothetical protein
VREVDRLGQEITTLAAHITAATARWLALIVEFDERGGWGGSGAKSLSQWLSWMCSVSPFTAREYVRVARRVRDLPVLAAAFARGELSYSKVRALTRIEDIPDENRLLELARHASASQLERIVSGYRSCLAVEAGARQAYDERFVSWSWDVDGSLILRGRLPAEQGALLVQALQASRDALGPAPAARPENVSAETGQPRERVAPRARNADALVALADASLENTGNSSTADRYQVVVHVEAATLQGDSQDDDRAVPRCELEDGALLPAATARRLACDGSLVRIVERDGKPLSVGRKTRTIPPALRRALRSRDGGCAFPGCDSTRHVDAHHIEHWADGGRTDIGNLVQLCRFHHRLLHEGGYLVRRRGDAFAFFTPKGQVLPQVPRPPRGDCATVIAHNDRRGVRVSAETTIPTDGGRMDLGMCVDAMLVICRRRE